ncbi:uncharacterized protein si:ch211-81a5.8 [Phyllopteryx taeniolatus]|uniref:uncharacterized protein si:ch211-81a5.8 n=1 Tax=Phyllopteryx taeniolatus TaxID=161469 RepID=UPI002AD1FFAC|nr:uncharacterized protein si:ch211-81a5.8 [Phyllopteryx taeniolatus]XP_061616322.1 uncharacterized protein si:ch211-81a5.8 [Phyllopteryx taeniolatus]
MDSILSLGAPLKQFTSTYVTGKSSLPPKGAKGRRSSFTRRRSISRRRSMPCTGQEVPHSHWLRVYQAELKRERKRQQAVLAKKNAERSVRKTYFRSHHCLPRKTTTTRKPAAKKEDSLFGAFQSLSLDGVIGGVTTSAAAGGDQCKVM